MELVDGSTIGGDKRSYVCVCLCVCKRGPLIIILYVTKKWEKKRKVGDHGTAMYNNTMNAYFRRALAGIGVFQPKKLCHSWMYLCYAETVDVSAARPASGSSTVSNWDAWRPASWIAVTAHPTGQPAKILEPWRQGHSRWVLKQTATSWIFDCRFCSYPSLVLAMKQSVN